MSAYRTERAETPKMPIWITPELHQEIKMFCVWKKVSIKEFIETAAREALRTARDK